MSVRIGIDPITWTNDDVPELGGDTPLEPCPRETRLAGYAGTAATMRGSARRRGTD